MAEHSKIEWTHHTFNPWWGCIRVSAACKHCYAESWARRLGLNLWDAKSERRFFSDAHWREPLRWNREAVSEGVRRRVFCASMADVFEKRRDLDLWRKRLWPLIESTPSLDWLLLTKRPQHVAEMAPWSGESWPENVWLGTTTENQHWADKRLPFLLETSAKVKFVSAEPLLGALDLRPHLSAAIGGKALNWVIAGGESGPHARPMNPSWAESLRDQCLAAGTAFHFKQWGHWGPEFDSGFKSAKRVQVVGRDGAPVTLFRLGKHATGRVLEGRTWDGFPTTDGDAR